MGSDPPSEAVPEPQVPTSGAEPAGMPPRGTSRTWVWIVVVVVLLAAGGATALYFLRSAGGCDIGGGNFDCEGIAFQYPESWRELDIETSDVGATPILSEQIGLDQDNNLVVNKYGLEGSVGPSTRPAFETEARGVVDSIAQALQGSVGSFEQDDRGEWVGYRFSASGTNQGTEAEVVGMVLARGTVQFSVVCIYEAGSSLAEGCQQALDTVSAA
ncbi:MAG: hypothetical protein WD757_08610 [Actinomycetota bacterium]